ncbi:MAG: hypothetical protein N2035_00140 [Chthoniobacterales bacterium]|nr:hypothetical protein [Chthoniobacterales bacterium]
MASSNLDFLRSGILLAGRYKLLERIPRWVSERRFRALDTNSQKSCNILFFSLSEKNFQTLIEWVHTLRSFSHSGIYSIWDVGEFQNFQYIVGEDVFAPSLRERVENEGNFSCDNLQRLFTRIIETIQFLKENHFPLPPLGIDQILVQPNALRPIIFPIPLPAHPSTPEDLLPGKLRDILYYLSTNNEPPENYSPELLLNFPPATRQAYSYVFHNSPTLQSFREFCSVHVTPLPTRPLPSILPLSSSSPAIRKTKSDEPDEFDEPSEKSERIRKRRPPPPGSLASKISTTVSIITFLCCVAFFAFAANAFLIPKPSQTTPISKANSPNSTLSQFSTSAKIEPLPQWPMDKPGQPGSAIPRWLQIWISSPNDPNISTKFEDYIKSLLPHEQALRMGLLPDTLDELEKAHQAGFLPASYILGRVLWGRESARSESIMATAARAGYKDAQKWCEELYINWKSP